MLRFLEKKHLNETKPRDIPELDLAWARYKTSPMAPDAMHYLSKSFWHLTSVNNPREQLDRTKTLLREIRTGWFWANPDLKGRLYVCDQALFLIERHPELDPRPIERIKEQTIAESRTVSENVYDPVVAGERIGEINKERRKRAERDDLRFKIRLSVAVIAIGVLGGLFGIFVRRIRKNRNRPPTVQYVKPPQPKAKPPQQVKKKPWTPPALQRITPNDPLVLKAIEKGTQEGVLSIGQILDAYDFVVKHMTYRYVPDGLIPRWPRETLAPVFQNCRRGLCRSVADCKSMTVVLASMLEGMGADTFLVHAERHLYLTVRVYQGTEIDAAEREITWLIKKRYGRRSKSPRFFRSDDGKHLFLALDPTMGPVPGIVNPAKIYGYYDSQPGDGYIPKLE